MSAAAKGIILEQEAEKGLADQLFGDADEDTSKAQKVNLVNEKDYKNYGKSAKFKLIISRIRFSKSY